MPAEAEDIKSRGVYFTVPYPKLDGGRPPILTLLSRAAKALKRFNAMQYDGEVEREG